MLIGGTSMNYEELLQNAINQLYEKGNLLVIPQFFTAGYTAHAADKTYKGHDFIERFLRQLRSAILDIKVLKLEFLARENDTVVWQRTLTGTHKSSLMGIPPSGNKVQWSEMVVTRFENENIAEEWILSELAGQLLLKQPKP